MNLKYTFASVDVKDELVKQLKEELPKFGYAGARTVKVIPSDPASPSELPCVGVNRIDDSESSQSIDDANGTHYDEKTKTWYEFKGTFFSESLEVRIWHTNADERDRLYQTVKGVLMAVRPDLVKKGLLNLTMRSGRDEQDSSMAQAPMVLYWSTITINYLNPLNVEYTQLVDTITGFTDNGNLTGGE